MAESQRIEDLRKRYHENPRRFFAPLANEYRKSGFLDRAILLCEKHLRDQPDNLNGLVVYGQTLFESGKTAEAKQPFESALALDPENLIALRHLGDVARLEGQNSEARRWYGRVLEVDRRNDEVIELLEQVQGDDTAGAAPAEPEAPAEAEASAEPVAELSGPLITVASSVTVSGGDDEGSDAVGMIDLDPVVIEPTSAAEAPPAPEPAASPTADLPLLEPASAPAPAAKTLEMTPPKAEAPSTPPPAAVAAPVAPLAKTASLLDMDFGNFGEPTIESAFEAPAASAPLIETPSAPPVEVPSVSLVDLPPEPVELPSASLLEPAPHVDEPPAFGGASDLIIDTSEMGSALAASESQLDGLETTEFVGDVDASAVAGFESDAYNLADADDVVDVADIAPSAPDLIELSSAPTPIETPSVPPPEPVELEIDEPSAPSAAADLVDATDAVPEISAPLPFLEDPPSARPKPRMTKADLASIPLLADYGLDDDEPSAPPAAEPPAVEPPAAEPPAAAPPAPRASLATDSDPEAMPEPLDFLEPESEPRSVSGPRDPAKQTPAFVTETMAALYFKQGYHKEAVDVYRQLVAQDPNDRALTGALAAAEEALRVSTTPAPSATAAVSSTAAPMRPFTPPPAAGPSAREFFLNFARRAAVATSHVTTPTPHEGAPATADASGADAAPRARTSTPTGWPLDALFGAATDVVDLHAAEVLAGVATFAGPSGGTGLDALFTNEGGSARPVVNRASQMLKFDQFFAANPTGAAPTSPASPASNTPASPAAAGDDDLDQFQGWLRGLKP